jgi:hypothetical protein
MTAREVKEPTGRAEGEEEKEGEEGEKVESIESHHYAAEGEDGAAGFHPREGPGEAEYPFITIRYIPIDAAPFF